MRILLLLFAVVSLEAAPSPDVRFSPNGGCTAEIVKEIVAAKEQILIQAYNFTSAPIGDALAAAARRGVKIAEIQDNVAANQKNFQGPKLISCGGSVFIDKAHKIAHNKIMIIDGAVILTGSFNFSDNAEKNNAENLLILKGFPDLVRQYSVNWTNHLLHSSRFVPKKD